MADNDLDSGTVLDDTQPPEQTAASGGGRMSAKQYLAHLFPSVASMKDDTIQMGRDIRDLFLFTRRDRQKRYHVLLDHCPLWMLFIVAVLVIVIMVVSLIVGSLAPVATQHNVKEQIQSMDMFDGTSPIVHTSEWIPPSGMEMYYYIRFGFNSDVAGMFKSDFKLRTTLYASNDDDDNDDGAATERQWTIVSPSTEVTRTLRCMQTSSKLCSQMIVYHERWIAQWRYYRAESYLVNARHIAEHGFFNGPMDTNNTNYVFYTGFTTNSEGYMAFEITFRMVYAAIMILCLAAFLVLTIKNQGIRYWHTYQRWLVVLLFLLVWYHDPLFLVQVFAGGFWLFPVVHIVLASTFVFLFLFYMLVFVHSLFKKPKERTILTFYLPKILLVGLTYALTVALLVWTRVHSLNDPAQVSARDVPGFFYIEIATVLLFVVYAFYLFYFIVRAFGSSSRMPKKYSARFRVVGVFSLLVVIALLGVLIPSTGMRQVDSGLGFFVSSTALTLYFFLLAVFFLPSTTVDRTKGARDAESSAANVELQENGDELDATEREIDTGSARAFDEYEGQDYRMNNEEDGDDIYAATTGVTPNANYGRV